MVKKAPIPKGYNEDVTKRIEEGRGCWSEYYDSWKPIIESYDKKIAEHDPDYVIDQIKTKFNWACFYVSGVNSEEGKKLVAELESKLSKTCTNCGSNRNKCGHWRGCRFTTEEERKYFLHHGEWPEDKAEAENG